MNTVVHVCLMHVLKIESCKEEILLLWKEAAESFANPWINGHTHRRLAAGFMLKLVLLDAGAD